MNLSILSKYRNVIYGVCALWIVVFHAVTNFGFLLTSDNLPSRIFNWFFTKSYGVDVFVFLSGISLYFSFYKTPSHALFIQKRFKRILPALLITYGVKWLIQVISGDHGITWMLWHLSLVPFFADGNTDGAWFYAFIMFLYFAYPYVHTFIYGSDSNRCQGERSIAIRTCLIIGLAMLLYWFSHKYSLGWFWKVEIASARIPVFVCGCYIGHFIKDDKATLSKGWTCAFILVTIAWFGLIVGPVNHSDVWWYRLFASVSGIVFAVAFAVVADLITRVAFGVRILQAFEWVGSFSLELYGTHLILFYGIFFFPPLDGNFLLLCIYIALALIWSRIDVKYIEPLFLEAIRFSWTKIQTG